MQQSELQSQVKCADQVPPPDYPAGRPAKVQIAGDLARSDPAGRVVSHGYLTGVLA